MSKLLPVALFMVGCPSVSLANGWYEPVIIERISVDNSGTAYLRVTPGSPAPGQTPPACSTNGFWTTTFDVKTFAGQAMLSVALTAKTSGKQVRLIGSGGCEVHPNIEGTSFVDILP